MEGAFRLFKSTREYLTPVLQESAFLDRGMLTPEEFVRAGDHLVRTNPSWSWESGEKSKVRPYLPNNKQFLVTRGVPSYQRVSALHIALCYAEENLDDSELTEGENKDSWCHTQFRKNVPDIAEDMEFIDKAMLDMELSTNGQPIPPEKATNQQPSSASIPPPAPPSESLEDKVATTIQNDEYIDMEDESLALDSATLTYEQKSTIEDPAGLNSVKQMQVRRYDVSITYDNYYRTPRVWLLGYAENGSVLNPEAIFEDVMQDYAKRTVTIDPHPHLSRSDGKVFFFIFYSTNLRSKNV